MRRIVCLALGLVVAGCHSSTSFDLALTFSPVVDEHPFAGVDTLELRWSRPGQARTVEHVAWKHQLQLSLPAPAIVDGTQLELAAIADGSVVAVGRTAPLAAGARGASAYVGLVNRFVATPTERALGSARFGASATRLGDGRVLIAGGAMRGSPGAPDPSSISPLVELYDPGAGTFTIFPAAGFVERVYHAAGATSDGGVLFAGGLGKFGPTDDIYKIDPARSASVGKLPGPRWGAAAAALADGRMLVVGGYTSSDGMGAGMLAADALVVSADGATSSIALATPRAFAAATRLADGNVLITGGVDANGARDDALLYSPAANSLTPLTPSANARAAMVSPRFAHSATLLPSGALFVFGGNDGHSSIADPELWSPDAGGFVDAPIFNVVPRQSQAVAALADGSVVLAGGESSPQKMSVPSPVLDPLVFRPAATGTAGVLDSSLARSSARAEATATTLADGSVLYVGGAVGDPRTLAAGAELLVPCAGACLAITP
jgi:hypothetical protein